MSAYMDSNNTEHHFSVEHLSQDLTCLDMAYQME